MTNAIAGRCSRTMTVGTLTLTLMATLLVSSAPAMATDINVSAVDVSDDNLCSLPEAVDALNAASINGPCGPVSAGDTLQLTAQSPYVLSRTLELKKAVTITSVNGRAVIDGDGKVRLIIIEAAAAGTVLSNLRLTGGNTATDPANSTGGGIQAKGSVRIDNVIMDNNQASIGGAIYVDPVINVDDIVVAVNNSHITENIALFDGGGIESGATLIVEATTVSGNTAVNKAGGILNTGKLFLRRSTISGNSLTADPMSFASLGAGIYNRGSISVEQSTIAFNSPDGFFSEPGTDDVVEFKSSLLAKNIVSDCSSEGAIFSKGHNLVQNAAFGCAAFSQTTDLLGQDPLLQPLAEAGSGIPVHLVDPSGAAFGKGDHTGIDGAPVAVDQRGKPRRVGVGTEIGAVEMQCSDIATVSCSVGVGQCKQSGFFACDNDDEAVCDAEQGIAEPEACNGLDDDCNGLIDDNVEILCGTACELDADCGGEGGLVCEGGVCTAGCRSDEDCSVGQTCDPSGAGTCIASGEGEGEGGGEIAEPGTPGDPGDDLPESLPPFRFVSCASGDTGAEVLGLFAVALLWRPRSRRRRPGMAALVVMLTWATTATAQAPTATLTTAPTTAPTTAQKKAMRTLSMDLEHRNVSAEQAQLITGMVAVELSTYDALDVVAGADIRRAMALEGDKQSMGCSADASCLAEIADAMDAELVVFGEIGVLDGLTIINLNLYDPRAVQSVGRATVRSRGPGDLDTELGRGIRQMLEKTLVARGHALPSSMATSASLLPVAVAAGGGVVAAVGAFLVFFGLGTAREYQRLSDAYDNASSIDEKRDLQEKAEAAQDAYDNGGRIVVYGGGAMVVVGLAVGIGGTMWALQGE
jgi:hypothetical protein